MRVIDYSKANPAASPEPRPDLIQSPPPVSPGLIAARLVEAAATSDRPVVYVALGESAAGKVARAIRCLDPQLDPILLPPWDCLPYDRVPPSRQCMGRRMDALRVWARTSRRPRLMVTSLDAALQRVPPAAAIAESWLELAVGETFRRDVFERFVRRTGYVEDGVVDEPGEYAFRDAVIDIFPAGALAPMRIVLSEDGVIAELRSYDPASQRTEHTVETMVFGPATEAVAPADASGEEDNAGVVASEASLLQLYGALPSLFDALSGAWVAFAPGTDERLSTYLDIIDEARQAHRDLGGERREPGRSLYLGEAEWAQAIGSIQQLALEPGLVEDLPAFAQTANPRRSLTDHVKKQIAARRTVVLAGIGSAFETLCRRVEREAGASLRTVERWQDITQSDEGALLRLAQDLDRGFVDCVQNRVVITSGEVLGNSAAAQSSAELLAEAELRLGDVVVHEDHGIGVLKALETVDVDGVMHDAARLDYRDGASILVPMEEFGKLWRYGSAPEAVTLDRLHTDAWAKKRVAIARDIRNAARHLLALARERNAAAGEVFAPPRAPYARFTARFPYAETADQAAAVDAVLGDLSAGKVMNRLICGDVGFGKTEVALRAAAAVALCGAQVVLVAPTTVLARQHFTTFERRFAGTGINVAMLSRVVGASEARRVRDRLRSGEIGVVVATHAILSRDVELSWPGLLIVDEEHRFGARDKKVLRELAPRLHTLVMSATPIPRTLQAAMIGVQDVSILATPPSRRRPVRTSLSVFDPASMRVALLRERRRGGQSFLVAPEIGDLAQLERLLGDIVPELSVRVAHGKMPVAEMDEVMVRFADGEGDVLLSTNIIESGLDVPRANTIFIWRADRFGLAQLHQLRGRVGRGRAQGIAYLLTEDEEGLGEETRLRLSAMVENDRLGAGLALSMQDLDLRGGGDIAGEDQAGHMKVIGVSLYQKMLERAVAATRKDAQAAAPAVLNLGVTGTIPADYVPDATVRLNLHARLLRAASLAEVDGFVEEFEDRFGELPEAVSVLLRLCRLKLAARAHAIARLDAGPRAMAVTFAGKPGAKTLKALAQGHAPVRKENRLIYEQATENGLQRIAFFEALLGPALYAGV